MLEIEIGCGKGKFLVARAEAHPHIQFIGIDKAGKWMKKGIVRSERRGLFNITFLRGDVREILEQEIVPHSVSVFHIYFPDPWPKHRHHKRRLLTPEFFRHLYQLLKPGGLIELATDDPDYFAVIKQCAVTPPLAGLWGGVRESVNQRLFEPELKTNYEIKYANAGRPLYYLELMKSS